MENAQYEPNLGVIKQELNNDGNDSLDEDKENLAPDEFDDRNIDSLAHQLIRLVKKSRTSKLYNRHSLTAEGINVELSQITHHATISRLVEIENTPKNHLRTHSVVGSEYIYEHVKSDTNVFKSRRLFPSAFESGTSSNNTIESKEIINDNDCTRIRHNQSVSSNISSSGFKMHIKKKKIKVFNSQDGVQVAENKKVGHSGIRVLEKQLHTTPKPFSFESRKSSVVETPQGIKSTEQQCMFKARPATVLKKKPFVPKHEKRYIEPKNICLNTERRAREWMAFEQKMKVNFSRLEELSRKRQEEIKKKEMDLIKNMRQLTIHKPEPIKKYKPIVIRKSVRPVTVPHSPRFSDRPTRNCLNSICE